MIMKTRFIIVFLLGLLMVSSYAQTKQDYIWMIGYSTASGDYHPQHGGVNLDFNEDEVELERIRRPQVSFDYNSSSISDRLGNLAFYTDGCYVFNAEDTLIENGELINQGAFKDDACKTGSSYRAGNASTILLPNPTNNSDFYLIHQRVEELFPDSRAILLYSKIDGDANNGLGKLTDANTIVSLDSVLLGEMAAVKHANGKDWWVIAAEDESNIYNLILIDENGVRKSHDQKIGSPVGFNGMGSGQCKFSPDGTKFARWTTTQQLLIADFDRATGTFSNDKQIRVVSEGTNGGTEFSPNSRFVYAGMSDSIFQFDTHEFDIESSKVLVAVWDGTRDFVRTTFRRMQITPDCRIFISMPGSHRFWHIIHNPNEKGIACNVEQRGLSLKTWAFNTMPYFPNYNLGAIDDTGGYPCDSTKITVSSSDIPIFESSGFVYPNPTSGQIHIDLPKQAGQVDFNLFSATGQLVFNRTKIFAHEEMDLGTLPKGIYFYKISDGEGSVWSGKLVVSQ